MGQFHTKDRAARPTNVDDSATSQQKIVEEFFLKDRGSEMIESLNTLIETYLFTENLTHVTPEMCEYIVNQLRVETLIAKLDASHRHR